MYAIQLDTSTSLVWGQGLVRWRDQISGAAVNLAINFDQVLYEWGPFLRSAEDLDDDLGFSFGRPQCDWMLSRTGGI